MIRKYFIFLNTIYKYCIMTARIKIAVDDKIPFLKGIFESHAEINYFKGSAIENSKIKNTDALIIRTRTLCNSHLLNNTEVKLITTATIGYDHIDTIYCKEHDIKWVNAPGCNSTSVMQYIASALFTFAEEKNVDLSTKTIGIVGVGNVGGKVARLCRAIGMKVLLNDPPRERLEGANEFVSLDEIKSSSDIITFHVPLTAEGKDKTYHIADETFFSGIPKGTVIINTSRGPVIKTTALVSAIRKSVISYAVLDVWENEPYLDRQLLELVNIATPHIAGYSADGKANGTAVCVNSINEYFNLGLPENWYPDQVPPPLNEQELEIDCTGMSYQQIFSQVILHTYNIKRDDLLLRKSPGKFEHLRDEYPVRREFQAYKVILSNAEPEIIKKIKMLGFQTEIKK